MTEEFDVWKVIQGIIWALTALFGWIGTMYVKLLDKHGDRLDMLERTVVTRAELERSLEQVRVDRRHMHEENSVHLEAIERKIELGNREAREASEKMVNKVQDIGLKIAAITGDVTGPHRRV